MRDFSHVALKDTWKLIKVYVNCYLALLLFIFTDNKVTSILLIQAFAPGTEAIKSSYIDAGLARPYGGLTVADKSYFVEFKSTIITAHSLQKLRGSLSLLGSIRKTAPCSSLRRIPRPASKISPWSW